MRLISLIGILIAIITLQLLIRYSPLAQAQSCVSGTEADGLISASEPTIGRFGNPGQICIQDIKAAYARFEVPKYEELKAKFYTQKRLTRQITTNPLPPETFTAHGSDAYLVNIPLFDHLIVSQSPTDHGPNGQAEAEIIFVGGNLSITSDINYHHNDAKGGLVFIVKGDINIKKTVTNIDAVLISEGTICTRSVDPPTDRTCETTTTNGLPTPKLTINGSLISLYQDPSTGPIPTSSPKIIFGRNLAVNNQSSELIQEEAKYLLILKGIFTEPIRITTELN